MNIGSIAIIGSILAGLLSIPATGAAVTGDITAAGATITGMSNDSFQDTPRTVTQEISPDAMTKTIETAFGTVSIRSTSDRFSADLETPQNDVSVEREPGRKHMTFTGEGVDLTVERTPDTVTETCATPDGTLTSEKTDGEKTVEFSGANQEDVEATCSAARDRLKTQVERINGVAADLGLVPDVDIAAVNRSTEKVVVRNTGETPVDLREWQVSDSSDNTYSFDVSELRPGETVTVYSDDAGQPETCEPSSGPDYERCWDRSHVWNDDGETATLRNAQGETADTFTYQ